MSFRAHTSTTVRYQRLSTRLHNGALNRPDRLWIYRGTFTRYGLKQALGGRNPLWYCFDYYITILPLKSPTAPQNDIVGHDYLYQQCDGLLAPLQSHPPTMRGKTTKKGQKKIEKKLSKKIFTSKTTTKSWKPSHHAICPLRNVPGTCEIQTKRVTPAFVSWKVRPCGSCAAHADLTQVGFRSVNFQLHCPLVQ